MIIEIVKQVIIVIIAIIVIIVITVIYVPPIMYTLHCTIWVGYYVPPIMLFNADLVRREVVRTLTSADKPRSP